MAREEKPISKYDFEYRHYKELFFEQNISKKGYAKLFEQAAELERCLGKDISEFTLEQIELLLSLNRAKGVAQKRNVIEHYINFVKFQNNDSSNENPASKKYIIKKYNLRVIKDWEEQFKRHDKYLTYNDINNIIDLCRELNPQDALIIKLLFEGMDLHEIGHLKISDISGNLINANGRDIKADSECLKLIHEAYESTEYITYEPSLTPRRNGQPFHPAGGKIIKKVDMNIKEDEKYPYGYISTRLTNIKKYFSIKEKFTKNGIRHAGVIYKAKQLYESYPSKREYLRMDDCNRLAKEYGTSSSIWVFYLTKLENVETTYPSLMNNKSGDRNALIPNKSHNTENNFYKFWRIQEEYGEAGERIVRKELEHEGYIVNQRSPVFGYDFWAERDGESLQIEVKTTTSIKGTIYMSINELEVAYREGEQYFLYIVHLTDKKNEIGSIYTIKDPINSMQIDMNKVYQQLSNEQIFGILIVTHNIAIKLNPEFIGRFCNKWPTHLADS